MKYAYIDKYGYVLAHDKEESAVDASAYGGVVLADIAERFGRLIDIDRKVLCVKVIPNNFNGDYVNPLVDPNYDAGYEVEIYIDDFEGKRLNNDNYSHIMELVAEMMA